MGIHSYIRNINRGQCKILAYSAIQNMHTYIFSANIWLTGKAKGRAGQTVVWMWNENSLEHTTTSCNWLIDTLHPLCDSSSTHYKSVTPTNVVEVHHHVVQWRRTGTKQIFSRITKTDCTTFQPCRPLSVACKTQPIPFLLLVVHGGNMPQQAFTANWISRHKTINSTALTSQ